MLDLADSRWLSLTGGYRVPYDPRPALQLLAKDAKSDAAWDELWNQLHHQGDLGTASFAAVPVLVAIFERSERIWQFYAILALIEQERFRQSNPRLPDWIERAYHEASAKAHLLALRDLATTRDALTVRSALTVVAFAAGDVKVGALLNSLDQSEIDELLEDRLDWGKLYEPRAC